ncbi:uncharacterized protein L969DRAFT_26691 [Mixia osmundae IAM 14324]|uniref:60S ribosomal protein L35 n=1 Tax=Mixia osmundae (strain CBS 9802 / IAM 14324 / JCM 22182 / KY 12970) TaxID=764103 RepID=G7DV28_MIXOS|nr:uncharacterized protein L969DRAFT_26691 [Mixia osmundae IAM 14324]KEI36345.1 hypothetical protein L969DRAFT_26691 [Mixia osmundae IAM 14324]GAA94438.1 hypothetical protein E5Q_01090 [Mixia osmundae IAM 14324]
MSSSSKVKAHELVSKSKADLMKQLEELKQEATALRVQKVTGGNQSKLQKIKTVRKSIARVLTVVNAKQRQAVREHSKNKRLPLDLRPKKTRAIRRRLSKSERTAKTERTKKRLAAFPQRKYAVKA